MRHNITGPQHEAFCDTLKQAIEYTNQNNGDLDMIQTFLRNAGWLHATFGIESVQVGLRELRYLSVKEKYGLTIGQEDSGPAFLTSWGDWAEAAEQESYEGWFEDTWNEWAENKE